MNNLKEIDEKNYLKAKVVMLQSDKPSYLQIIQRNILKRKEGTLEIHDSPWADVDDDFKPQHLYITSEEKINLEDFIYDPINKKVWKCGSIINDMAICDKLHNQCHIHEAKKIIATTDKSFNESIEMAERKAKEAFNKILSEPSFEFIKKFVYYYNSGTPITDILFEYELGFNGLYKAKVDENDNIIIKGKSWDDLSKIGSPEKWMEVYLHYQELLLENDAREFLENIPKPNWNDIENILDKTNQKAHNGVYNLNDKNDFLFLLSTYFNTPTLKKNK